MELDPVEQRVIGCLIEKERATPQNYPLTLNALRLACNQSTNRDPVVDFDDGTIERALLSLRERSITRIVYSTSNRAAKYRHVVDDILHVGDDGLAVLCVLLLRGPQTVGEIKGRTDRLFTFPDLGGVQETLDRLASREAGPLVVRLERRPGQKDVRWAHLLGTGPPPVAADFDDAIVPSATSSSDWAAASAPPTDESERVSSAVIDDLTGEIARLDAELTELRAEFDRFRSQFD